MYRTYCSGYTGTPVFKTKAEARKWCLSVTASWRKMKHAPIRFTKLDSGEEHWRMETATTLDVVGFKNNH